MMARMRNFKSPLSRVAVLLAMAPLSAFAAPLITEFLAVNDNSILDEDNSRQDWIEIFNPDGTTLDLGGYHLTDDALQPTKWTVPAGFTIPAGGYVVIFASGKDRKTIGSPLHTSFSLTSNGEYLGLYAPGGTGPALSEYAPTFPVQSSNVSYGLESTLPGAAAVYFTTPTPGAANNPATAQADPVTFSLSSRTFNQGNSLTLTLSTPSGAGTIRYTTDRSVPTASSPAYTGPITVNYSARIRARAFAAGKADGPVASESYLMLDAAAQSFTSNLPIMILHDWGAGHPSSTAPSGTQPEDTKQAVWFVFEPKAPDNLARMTNLPDLATPGYFERRGSSTFGAAKYSMTMGAFDETNAGKDVSPLGYPSNDDFVMNAAYDFDRTLIHNDLIYKLSNELGRYAVRTKHFELFTSVGNDVAAGGGLPAYGVVNGATAAGDYYGVYSFQEKISRGSQRVDVEKMTPADNTAPNVQGGYIFKIDRLDNGDAGVAGGGRSVALVYPKEYTSYPTHLAVATTQQKAYLSGVLNSMYAACTSSNFMNPTTGYQAWLDVPAAIDHHILSMAPKSADAFRLSGYWSKSRFGKLTMGPIWDFDRAQGSTDGRDLNPNTWRGDNGDLGTDYFHNASIYQPNYFHYMFQDPNFWQAWIDRLHEMRTGNFSTAHVMALIDEYTELLDPGNAASTPAKRNFQKWGTGLLRGASASTPGTNSTYRGEMAWLKNWWTSRLSFMDGQFTRPATATPVSGPVAPGAQVVLTSPSQSTPGVKIYYTMNGTDPRPQATAPETPVGGLVTIATLLPEINPVRAIVPTSTASGGTAGTEWRGADLNSNGNNQDDFNDSTWFTNAAGTINGVGYDNNADPAAGQIDFRPYFGIRWNTSTFNPFSTPAVGVSPVSATNVMFSGAINGTSYAGNQTCYIRWPFTVSAADAALLTGGNRVVLQVRYDDGFVAWLNGTELTSARMNANATSTLVYNSGATTTHDDTAATQYADFDITPFMSSIHAGNNILAFQGMNAGVGSSDFVMQARIVVQSAPPPYSPTIAAAAAEYTAPITINGPTQLFVRTVNPVRPSDPPTASGGGTGTVPNGSSWSAPTKLYYFPGSTPAGQSNIRITEVLYHPLAPAADELTAGFNAANDFEFIRLTNTGATPVDLTGIYFSHGVEFTATAGLQNWLPAGQSVIIAGNVDAYNYRYGAGATVLGKFKGNLDDNGEHVVLNDKTGAVISDFTYSDKAPWPKQADRGYSLLNTSGDQNVPGNWRVSLDPGGAGVNSYASWQKRYFSNADIPFQTMSQDTDGDGLNNLGEYVFGTDPRSSGSGENAMGWTTPGVTPFFNVRRRTGLTGVTFVFETSTGLGAASWTSTGAGPVSVTDNGDGTETATWQSPAPPASGTRLFMRVRITTP